MNGRTARCRLAFIGVGSNDDNNHLGESNHINIISGTKRSHDGARRAGRRWTEDDEDNNTVRNE
jgi:hypothetical protein